MNFNAFGGVRKGDCDASTKRVFMGLQHAKLQILSGHRL